jgi:hypothetical protein
MDPILERFTDLSTLTTEEVIGVDAPEGRLEELVRQLEAHFPDHAHVGGEMREAWASVTTDPDVIVHAWLFSRDTEPVGFAIVNTSVRRQILLQHYFGMDPDAGRLLPLRWVGHLMDALRDTGIRDCERNGTVLLAQVGEHYEEHLRAWARFGYRTLDVDYREPRHGRHWADYGAPEYFAMYPQMRLTDAGEGLPLAQVAVEAVSAFLLDHYRLPADDPTVARTLALAAALPG